MNPIVIVILFLAFAGVALYFAHLAEKKRRDEMAALAARLGFRFDPGPDSSHDEEYAHFEVFRRGHGRVAKNRMSGKVQVGDRSMRVVAGDFRYKVTSGSGKNRRTRTHDFSYAIFHLPFHPPDLLIRTEGMFDKIAGVFGFDDIDFESEAFSRRFHVKSGDKKFAYDVCHARMMEFLMREFPATVDLEHGRLLIADGTRRWPSETFRRNLFWVEEFLELWPEHLLVALDGPGGTRLGT